MTSDMLQKARAYEQEKGAAISQEERPAFHVTPKVGWMNDPNGFSVYQGKYHLFYQSHPYSNAWGPMHWGHVVSEDLLHWEHLPSAIAPDTEYDKGGCFSGSAIEMKDGKQLLLYTGVKRQKDEDGIERDLQTQCVAVGDGIDFEKYENNPVLDAKDVPEGFSANDFRDPKIFENEDGSYGCVVGNRTEDESGAILLFRSEDGFEWKFVSVMDRSRNEYGKMWECPDYFELDGKKVIITSPQEMNADGYEFHNGNCTMALIGTLEESDNSFCRESVQAIDYGLDFYAPQTLLSPDGRRIMIGWMQNWDTCIPPAGAKYFGQMSLPRELSLREGRFVQNPVKELEAMRQNKVEYKDVLVCGETTLPEVKGRVLDMTVEVKPEAGAYESFCIEFAKDDRFYSFLTYNPRNSVLRISREHAGINRDVVHHRECKVRNNNGEIKLRIVMDKFSAEIFVNDGEQALSMTMYTPQTAEEISFSCSHPVKVSVTKYDLI